MKRILGVTTIALFMTLAVSADDRGRIAERREAQQERIGSGVATGQLTPKEAAKLEKKEAKLNRKIYKERTDGNGLTPKERAKIERKQDKLSREITKEKHDRQVQPR